MLADGFCEADGVGSLIEDGEDGGAGAGHEDGASASVFDEPLLEFG